MRSKCPFCVLIVILLDQSADDIHQRGERMRLIAAHLIDDLVENGDESVIFGLVARNKQYRRYIRPDFCRCL